MTPRRWFTGLLLAGFTLSGILGTPGCRRQSEPARLIPSDWQVWRRDNASFRYPSRCTVTTETFDPGDLKVFISDDQNQGNLMLCLVFGDEGPFPVLQAAKDLGRKPAKALIHGHPTLRHGPGRTSRGAFSEGLMELGGEGRFRSVHFYYANLDPGAQDLVETIIASVQRGE